MNDLILQDLTRSGLSTEDVTGIRELFPQELMPLPDASRPAADGLLDSDGDGYDPDEPEDGVGDLEAEGGYAIPYFTLDGKPIQDRGKHFERVRLVGRKNEDVPRYRSPKGSQNHVYVPQGLRDLLIQIAKQSEILPETRILYVTEGEKKAIRAVKAGIPCIALPGVTMWADSEKVRHLKAEYAARGGDPKNLRMSEDTPVNPELIDVLRQAKSLCPSIGIVSVLFDSDGLPIPEKDAIIRSKGGVTQVGGIEWYGCDTPMAGSFVSANPQVTRAAYTLAAALRKQADVRVVTTAQFCRWDRKDPNAWQKQGLDDWLQEECYAGEVARALRRDADKALRLYDVIKDEPLFGSSIDPDALGIKGGPSAEIAYSRMLDGNRVGQADGLLYEWVGSHWQVVEARRAEQAAHRLVDAFYAESGSARKVSDAPKMAVSAPHLQAIPEPRRWKAVGGAIIPCADCTLDISQTGEITAREPDKLDGLRYCVNARWADKDKPSPEFDKFIQDTLPDPDVRRLVQQYVGYTLISDTRFQVAQWWFGSGANGKGFLAQIVSALHRKVAAADVEDLGGFGAENLIDASLITVDETPKRVDEQRLKSAISGDDLNINRKYHVPVTVRLRGKWILRGNDKPALSDQTDGLWRRLQIIEFTQKFEGNRRDDMLADRIVENELAGVLRWAVDGLVMLLKQQGFKDIPESVSASKRAMQLETDNVLGWWTERHVRLSSAPCTGKDRAYTDYAAWCKSNGMMPLGSPRFWNRVRAIADKEGGHLEEVQARVRVMDPLDGSERVERVRKINLEIDPDDEEASGASVVPLVPRAPQAPRTEDDVMDTIALDEANLPPEEGDFEEIPF